MKREYLVKRTELDLKDHIFKVIVPLDAKEKDVRKNLKIASEYAQYEFWEDEEYKHLKRNPHYKEMKELRKSCNGDEAFSYYLEHFCGYLIEDLQLPNIDFEFEW